MAGGVTGGAAGAWSDRFEQGLHPFIEAFNASIGFDLTLLQEDLDGSMAHARMLASCGVIAEEEAVQLVEGLEMGMEIQITTFLLDAKLYYKLIVLHPATHQVSHSVTQ